MRCGEDGHAFSVTNMLRISERARLPLISGTSSTTITGRTGVSFAAARVSNEQFVDMVPVTTLNLRGTLVHHLDEAQHISFYRTSTSP